MTVIQTFTKHCLWGWVQGGVERWLIIGERHLLLLLRTQVHFPGPVTGDSTNIYIVHAQAYRQNIQTHKVKINKSTEVKNCIQVSKYYISSHKYAQAAVCKLKIKN